jgi:hypothetical protein
MSKAYDYPLLSGKRLGDATRKDLLAEAKIDREMDAIGGEMGDMTFDQFFESEPAKAIRLIGYIAQCNFLAERRAKALDQPEPDFDLVVQKRVSREALLQKIGRDLNG